MLQVPKLKASDETSALLERLFPTPSASVNGKMIVGMESLEKSLDSEIQQEIQQISIAFQMMRMRSSMVPQQQITNFAYSQKFFHPMLGNAMPELS